VLFNLLPAGAMTLGLALRSTLSAEFGLPEGEASQLELWANIISATGMVLGGWASDRFGRRRTLFLYILLMSLPIAWLGWRLQQLGYVMPVDPGPGGAARQPALAAALWIASMAYQFFLGLMYGTRSAIMMDVTTPKVAGTQFTAYMAMANLALAYSATWLGVSAEALGYPKTLFIDACVGLLSLMVLPLLVTSLAPEPAANAARRARWLAGALALVCLLWLPLQSLGAALGPWKGIAGTFMSLGFIVSAVVLVCGSLVLPRSALTRLAPWVALGLVLLAARNLLAGWLPALGGVWGLPLAVAGAALLAGLALQRWESLKGT
jgi:PAT family beta-lactamase induction signal transducer AmpG